jgi:hypothetical protein
MDIAFMGSSRHERCGLPSKLFSSVRIRAPADPAVRLILGITLLLLGLGMLSCRMGTAVPEPALHANHQSLAWVRTVDGWERPESWATQNVGPPRLHPLVVAAGQGLASLLGLAACQRDP